MTNDMSAETGDAAGIMATVITVAVPLNLSNSSELNFANSFLLTKAIVAQAQEKIFPKGENFHSQTRGIRKWKCVVPANSAAAATVQSATTVQSGLSVSSASATTVWRTIATATGWRWWRCRTRLGSSTKRGGPSSFL